MSKVDAMVSTLLVKATDKQLMDFKVNFLGMPEEIAKHPFFGAKNIMSWGFIVSQYSEYVRHLLGKSGSGKAGSDEDCSDEDCSDEDCSNNDPKSLRAPPPLRFGEHEGAGQKNPSSTVNKRKADSNGPETSKGVTDAKRTHLVMEFIDMCSDDSDEGTSKSTNSGANKATVHLPESNMPKETEDRKRTRNIVMPSSRRLRSSARTTNETSNETLNKTSSSLPEDISNPVQPTNQFSFGPFPDDGKVYLSPEQVIQIAQACISEQLRTGQLTMSEYERTLMGDKTGPLSETEMSEYESTGLEDETGPSSESEGAAQ